MVEFLAGFVFCVEDATRFQLEELRVELAEVVVAYFKSPPKVPSRAEVEAVLKATDNDERCSGNTSVEFKLDHKPVHVHLLMTGSPRTDEEARPTGPRRTLSAPSERTGSGEVIEFGG